MSDLITTTDLITIFNNIYTNYLEHKKKYNATLCNKKISLIDNIDISFIENEQKIRIVIYTDFYKHTHSCNFKHSVLQLYQIDNKIMFIIFDENNINKFEFIINL